MRNEKEDIVLKQCLSYLQHIGLYVWRNNTGAMKMPSGRFVHYGKCGSSDIIGITKDGRFLAVECKRNKGGVVSAEQVHFLSTIKRNGGVAIVASSLEQLIEELKKNSVIE